MPRPPDAIYDLKLIRKRRRELGFSLSDVARMTGMSTAAISRIETQPKCIPPAEKWFFLCVALKLNPIQVLLDVGAMEQDLIKSAEFLQAVLDIEVGGDDENSRE